MQVSKVLRFGENGTYFHWCPQCEMLHPVPVGSGRWTFNGDVHRPTFSPSLRQNSLCHYFITDGEIRYCGDSVSLTPGLPSFADWNISLPDIPPEWADFVGDAVG